MIQFFIRVIGPIFYARGVSEADLANYANLLSTHIHVFVFALLALLAVLIGAQFMRKEKRMFVRLQSLLAFVLVLVLLVNTASFGPLHNNIAGILNASNAKVSEASRTKSKEIAARVGAEGFVLLKNEGLLPLQGSTQKLNVFGWASTAPIYGGTGSGSSDTSGNVGILESLQSAGYSLNEELSRMYKTYKDGRTSLGLSMDKQSWELPEPDHSHYTNTLMNNAKAFSDTAVIVIGRSGGEGADLPTDMHAIIQGTYNIADKVSTNPSKYGYFGAIYENNGSVPDFDAGESYLELSNPEEDMIRKVTENFDKVIVIINANNPMELDWVDEYEQIGAVIYAPGGGVKGFDALGKIIKGEVNPSGKTVDTFVKDLFKTPYINHIGSHIYSNTSELSREIAQKDEAAQGVISFVNYAEGIYVGYKFYETAADEGFLKYEEHVQYPFGYGLSYTSFDKKIENFKDSGESLSFDVLVSNTGKLAGKDVVELYYTPPYTNGGIEKASVNLIEFAKTDELAPGASQTLHFDIPKEDMASYDAEGKKIAGGAYILEAGEYTLSLRSDSHTVLDTESFQVAEDIDYSKNARSTDKIAAINQFEDYARGSFTLLSRADKFANYEEATAKPADSAYVMDEATKTAVRQQSVLDYDSTKYDNPADTMPEQGKAKTLSLYDLAGAEYEDERWESLISQMSIEEMMQLINVGGWQTAEIKSIGKVATVDADGPAGLNNFITKVYGTSYPAEILMAQTWNTDLLAEVGAGITAEFADVKYYGWYAPGANTHRSAFAGRNFEYFSEDGVLAGKLAAAEMNGSVPNKVYAYLKHFALNDQETNRNAFLLTYTSEQALREIYLKPFELAVKNYKGKGQAMMSAFNFIGTVPASANGDLLQDVLRNEWGFKGMVITDYDGSYGYMISDKSIRNGNDLMLGFAMAESDKFTNLSASVVKAMRTACKNILYTVVNSGAYADGDPSGKMDNMTKIYLIVNIVLILCLLALEVLLLKKYLKHTKKPVLVKETPKQQNKN